MLGRQVARARVLRAFGVGFALLTGCTFDWGVRPDPPADGGNGIDAGADASEIGDATTTPADAFVDPDADATAVDCADLRAKVTETRTTARGCTFTVGECQQTVKDECDCDVVVRLPGSPQALAYESAVRALRDSGCPTGCTGELCPSTTPRNCLQKGAVRECYP